MPNTAPSSLTQLDLSSAQNAEFYMASSGASRKTTLSNIEGMIPGDQSTDLYLSTVPYVTAASAWTTLPFDVASRDPRGMFNAASDGLVQADFTGWARARTIVHVTSDGIDSFALSLRKNGNFFYGSFEFARYIGGGETDVALESHVFTVTSGDLFEVKYFTGTSMTIVESTFGPNRFVFAPVAIDL